VSKDEKIVSPEEQDILFEKAIEDYQKLPKSDPRFLGIDLDAKEYWVLGNKFAIKQVGFTGKKEISKLFDKHDDLARQLAEAIAPADAAKRIGLYQDMDHTKDEIVEKVLPILLNDGNGFDVDKWFGDAIPAATWWDVARDLYLFLRVKGSKDDILRSMTQSSTV